MAAMTSAAENQRSSGSAGDRVGEGVGMARIVGTGPALRFQA